MKNVVKLYWCVDSWDVVVYYILILFWYIYKGLRGKKDELVIDIEKYMYFFRVKSEKEKYCLFNY